MNPALTFAEASAFRLWFGKHMGRSLDEVAETDDGLLYLDWMRGELEAATNRSTRRQVNLDNLKVYLADPTIALEVVRAVRRKESWREA